MPVTFTASQLITRAGTLVGIFSQGEVPSGADGQDALAILNGLLDGFATQRLTMPASQREVFAFVAGTSTYTVGPTGVWLTTRPVSIDAMAVLSVNATTPFEIPLTRLDDQSYNALTIKTLSSIFPVHYYYNATAPNGTLFVWPTPSDAANYRAVLYSPTQLTVFEDLSTSATMAPGYYRMLYYNLAVELAPAFGKPADALILKFSADSLADIKRLNLEMVDLGCGAPLPGMGGIYNIHGDMNY